MSAQLLGDVGVWGFDSDEDTLGLIIEGIKDVSRCAKNYLRNENGARTGRADYDESIEIEVNGKMMSASGFDGKLSAELTLSNSVALTHLNEAGPGKTFIDQVENDRKNEDWQDVKIEAETLPFWPAA